MSLGVFRGVDFWPHNKTFELLSFRRPFVIFTSTLLLIALTSLFTKGLNFGIDFKGGSLLEIQSKSGPVDIGDLRSKLSGLDLGDVQIQGLDRPEEALIRIEEQPAAEGASADEVQQAAAEKVKSTLGESIEIRRVEVVGPGVSNELKQAGIVAVCFAFLGILLYVWFRFEWQFGVAAIVALVHDIALTLGAFSLLQLDFGLNEVAALLTLAGYSINDTVVIFDRVRENLRRYKKMPLKKLVDISVSETLSRTVITSGSTLFVVLAIYLLGSDVIHGFAFALLIGIVAGTWSTVFIAAPMLVWIGVKRDWSGTGSAAQPAATAKA